VRFTWQSYAKKSLSCPLSPAKKFPEHLPHRGKSPNFAEKRRASFQKTKGIVLKNEALPFEKRRASFEKGSQESGVTFAALTGSQPIVFLTNAGIGLYY